MSSKDVGDAPSNSQDASTSGLDDLLRRVEAATGPDREIDAAVMFDLFAKPVGARDDGGPTGYLWPEDNPSWSFGIRFPGKDREWFTAARQKIDGETLTIWRDDAWVLMNSLRIPPLTASVDAALALAERVLPGCMWRVGFDPDDGSMKAEIVTAAPRCVSVRANHDTPALAICAAVLRAIRHDARDGAPQHNPEAQSHG